MLPFEFASEKVGKQFLWTRYGSGPVNDILHKYDYKVLHLFGDTDAACSLLGIRKWIKSLKWKVTKQWEAWLDKENDDELIGYKLSFGNYTLATMFGMGHSAMFSKAKPATALVLDFIRKNSV